MGVHENKLSFGIDANEPTLNWVFGGCFKKMN